MSSHPSPPISTDAIDYLISTLPLSEVLRILVAAEDMAASVDTHVTSNSTTETKPAPKKVTP